MDDTSSNLKQIIYRVINHDKERKETNALINKITPSLRKTIFQI